MHLVDKLIHARVIVLKETDEDDKDHMKDFMAIDHPDIHMIEQDFRNWQLPDILSGRTNQS